jgi:hypothetical protein
MKAAYNTTAVSSFIIGLFCWVWFFNYAIGLLAAYLGIRSLRQIKKEKTKGSIFSVFGIILGIIPYFFGLLFLLRKYGHLDVLPFILVSAIASAAGLAVVVLSAVIYLRK